MACVKDSRHIEDKIGIKKDESEKLETLSDELKEAEQMLKNNESENTTLSTELGKKEKELAKIGEQLVKQKKQLSQDKKELDNFESQSKKEIKDVEKAIAVERTRIESENNFKNQEIILDFFICLINSKIKIFTTSHTKCEIGFKNYEINIEMDQ